ncbi:hypothetical protein HS125_04020 [bacterium]|nr:hypothetical protein [bacterium]
MPRAALAAFVSITFLATLPEVFAMPQTPRTNPWPLDDLRRADERHGTLGPTGRRLNTDVRKEGLGLSGRFCYMHHGTDVTDPVRVRLLENGRDVPLASRSTVWYPSHFEYVCTHNDLLIEERKFITDDDVALTTMVLRNQDKKARTLTLELGSGLANRRAGSVLHHLDLSRVANLDPAPRDRISAMTRSSSRYSLWWEAEHWDKQRGSQGRDTKAAASAGEVLGFYFGTYDGHFAQYDLDLPALPESMLWMRVARAPADSATWTVELDGKTLAHVAIPSTGGWGDRPKDFIMLCVATPAIKAGTHTFRISCQGHHNNVNFDGFLLSDSAFTPPEPGRGAPPFDATATPRFLFKPGLFESEGVSYQLLDAHANRRKSLVALRGGPRNSPAAALPARIEIPVPDSMGEIGQVHFVGQTGGFLASATRGATLARYRIVFADGHEEVEELVAGRNFRDQDGRAAASRRVGPFLLHSLLLKQPGALKSIVFEKADTRVAPVLAAITLEQFDRDDTRWAAQRDFFGEETFALLDGRLVDEGGAEVAGTHGDHGKLFKFTLAPDSAVRFTAGLAMSGSFSTCQERLADWLAQPDPFARHRAQYQAWFDDNVPTFTCSDPYMEKLWKYRWFVARHCLCRAGVGYLQDPCFYEGLRYYMRLISYSSPHIMNEVRWLRDSRYAFGQVRNHARLAGENGEFRDGIVHRRDSFYTHWISRTTWDAYQVHPDKRFLAEIAPAMASDTLGIMKVCDANNNALLAPPSHWHTGMEWQPSFWYFHRFDNTKDEAKLERADYVAYHYGNASAKAAAFAELGDASRAAEFNALADRIQKQCLFWMWDRQDQFFYSIRESDAAVALCREIVGFYPFYTLLAPDHPHYTAALRYLVDPNEFWNPFPLATVTKKNVAYSPHIQEWPGPGGRITGCMWNGPTWPHANSIIANVMANALRLYRQDAITPKIFWDFMDRYTHLQFENDDLEKPMIQEYYDGETGRAYGCRDYFHSTYNDLIIRCLGGLEPATDDVVRLRPIPSPLRWFRLDGIPYHGHELSITWSKGRTHGRGKDRIEKGFRLYIDGRLAARSGDLGPLEARLP